MNRAVVANLRGKGRLLSRALIGGTCALLLTGALPGEPDTAGSPPAARRLNESQYVNSIEDIFGKGILIPGRFEPRLRDEGLMAIGDAKVAVTPSGFEQYELRAREISAQVLSEKRRGTVMPCTPKAADAADDACARQFLTNYGRLLFRRPLDAAEMTAFLTTSRVAATSQKNFYKGLEASLARLLVSPYFIFRFESAQPGRGAAAQRLDDYSFATRLSFLFWDAPPDQQLLDAAALGTLTLPDILNQQINRLTASPKFEQGVRAFFSDMFAYDQFDGLTKEQAIYKKFVSKLAKDAQEQSLRTIVDHLVTSQGDYRDLFTTRKTFMNRGLASLYKVPLEASAFDGWTPYTFEPGDQRQGLLSLAGFLMLDPSHEGRSSPTIRGKFVRELLMCQKVPVPPANVDFAVVQDTSNPNFKTARQRLTAHQKNPVCAGCHAITDPLGLAMENYDAIGQFRTTENGAPIDTSGTFQGKPFKDLLQLQSVMRDDPGLPMCLSQRVYEYGVGHSIGESGDQWLAYINQQFARDGYKLPALMRIIATSKAFRTVAAAPPAKIAAK